MSCRSSDYSSILKTNLGLLRSITLNHKSLSTYLIYSLLLAFVTFISDPRDLRSFTVTLKVKGYKEKREPKLQSTFGSGGSCAMTLNFPWSLHK